MSIVTSIDKQSSTSDLVLALAAPHPLGTALSVACVACTYGQEGHRFGQAKAASTAEEKE